MYSHQFSPHSETANSQRFFYREKFIFEHCIARTHFPRNSIPGAKQQTNCLSINEMNGQPSFHHPYPRKFNTIMTHQIDSVGLNILILV